MVLRINDKRPCDVDERVRETLMYYHHSKDYGSEIEPNDDDDDDAGYTE